MQLRRNQTGPSLILSTKGAVQALSGRDYVHCHQVGQPLYSVHKFKWMLVFFGDISTDTWKYFNFLFHVYGYFACIDVYCMCVCVWNPQTLDDIRLLELQMVESHNVGVWTQTLVPWKISQCALNCWATAPALACRNTLIVTWTSADPGKLARS